MDEINNTYEFQKETVNYRGQYLEFTTKEFKIMKNGEEKIVKWECASPKIHNEHIVCGSEIIALVNDNYKKSIILIENFRYPIKKKIIEFPAGYIEQSELEMLNVIQEKIDNNHNDDEKKSLQDEFDQCLRSIVIASGKRELKEETGYEGKFLSFFALPEIQNPMKVQKNVFYDPWKGYDNSAIIMFVIDMSLKINQEPQQNLDDCEIIKVHQVDLENLLEFLTEKIEKENYGCTTHLYSFAMGLKFNEILNKILS